MTLARWVKSTGVARGVVMLALLLATCLHSLTWTRTAGAQTPTDGGRQTDDARARELYAIGDEFYANGRYEAAEEAFAAAYRLSGRPLLLFNLANAQERSGRWPEAVDNLRRYREYASESEHAALDARVTALERRIDARAAESRDEPVVVVQHESAELPVVRTVQERRVRQPLSPHWLLLPASGALSVVTVVLALRTRAVREDIRTACVSSGGTRFCSPQAVSAITRDRRLSLSTDVLAVATLATAALGVWSLVRHRQRSNESPTLQIGLSRDGVSLGLSGAF